MFVIGCFGPLIAVYVRLGVANQSAFAVFWTQNTTGATRPSYNMDAIASNLPPASIVLQVNAENVIRQVTTRIFGWNTAIWDGQLGNAANRSLLAGTSTQSLR